MSDLSNKLFRLWYYFRTGYSIYVLMLVNAISFILIIYYLTFQYLNQFLFIPVIVGFEIIIIGLFAIFLGWLHFKETFAFESEVDIQVESNPYFYKAHPGRQKEWELPMNLFILKAVLNLQEKYGLIPDDEKAEIIKLCQKINCVIKGGAVGKK